MKKILLGVVAIFFAVTLFSACEDCATCKQRITYDDGTIEEKNAAEYCGDDLTAKESEEPVEIGGATNEWVCE